MATRKTRRSTRNGWRLGVALVVVVAALNATAQWMQQVITLKKGWNAVHLKVNPADSLCSKVFGTNGQITQVSWWNRDRRDDGSGIAPSADILNWYATNPSACTFNRVIGGYSYLVKADANTSITVKGTPARARSKVWLNEMNLVGLYVPSTVTGLLYRDYYEPFFSSLDGNPFYTINATTGDAVQLSTGAAISSADAAIWLKTVGSGVGEYSGPLAVNLDAANEVIDFSANSEVRRVTVKNVSARPRKLKIALETSLAPPSGQGTLAGAVKLMKEEIDWTAGYARRIYVPCTFPIVTNLAAGATFELGLRPDLDKLPNANGAYQGILAISDAGTVIDGETLTNGTCLHRLGVRVDGHLSAAKNPAGLWMGTAVLTGVNRVKQLSSSTNTWNSTVVQAANQPFSFRLIMHVDASGNARLLKEVFVATEREADSSPTILTNRAAAIAYRERHRQAKIRRLSSANFPFAGLPLKLTGSNFAKGGTFTGAFVQAYNDRVNPFVHAYHPQHDNKKFVNKKMQDKADGDAGEGDFESWAVQRAVTLTFATSDPTGASDYDWNRTVTGGTYREEVRTLTRNPIITEGAFRITKILDTPTITP